MGHYANLYGYVLVHKSEFDAVKAYINTQKKNKKYCSQYFFVCSNVGRSGFASIAINGDIKEYHSDDPNEFIDQFLNFIHPIKGLYCVLGIDSETGIYPKQIRYVRDSDDWFEDENS